MPWRRRRSRPIELAQNTFPTTAASWSRALLRLGEAVEAGGDDALERLRERELVGRALLDVELDELLGVQRVAARALEQRI